MYRHLPRQSLPSSSSPNRSKPEFLIHGIGQTYKLAPTPDRYHRTLRSIICVHGLNSTPEKCWGTGDVLWLRDLLPNMEGLKNTRIVTFGFNYNVLEAASTAKIRDHARDLLQDLSDERKDEETQHRPIIFICHSLGGIVVKQALVMANQSQSDKPNRFEGIKMATYGIIFLATLHRGSELVSLGRMMARIAKLAFQDPKTQLLKSLKENSQQLQDLSREFSNIHSLFQIVSCYEQKETAFGKGIFAKKKLVVPKSSAVLGIEGEILVAMNTDHHNVCKFSDANDPGYIRVSNRIAELVRKSSGASISDRFPSQRMLSDLSIYVHTCLLRLITITRNRPTSFCSQIGAGGSGPCLWGANVASVALRIVYELYQSCTVQFGNVRNYTEHLRRCQETFFSQERLFAHVCLSILHTLVGKGVAAAMLEDKDHLRWEDLVFRIQWNTISSLFNTPLKGSRKTLENIRDELSKLYSDLNANEKISPVLANPSLVESEGPEGIVLAAMETLQQLVRSLSVQNQSLRYLQERRSSEGTGLQSRERYPKPPNSKPVLKQLLNIREVAKKVYDGLAATARCSCHCVNLQLQGQLDAADPGPDVNHTDMSSKSLLISGPTMRFRFIIIKDTGVRDFSLGSDMQCECTCITIKSELQVSSPENLGASMTKPHPTYVRSGKKRVRFTAEDENNFETSSARAIITISEDGETSRERVMSIDIGRGRKRVKLEVEVEDNNESSIDIMADSEYKTIAYDINTSAETSKVNILEIDNLCLLLTKLQSGGQTRELLGRIPHKGFNPTYQHLIYRDPPISLPTSRISLERILARPDKQCLLSRLERLKVALVLSLSLLHFGSYSTSWFQERWRSRDIFFFLEAQKKAHEPGNTLNPYVVPCFPTSDKNIPKNENTPTPSAPPRGIARNEQLFSLALVLIETAFGDTLFKIYEPAEIPERACDDFAEYMKAKKILDSGRLAEEMGPVYAEVVSRCMYCDFGINGVDLSRRELQEIYYKKVICELERCLKSFKGL